MIIHSKYNYSQKCFYKKRVTGKPLKKMSKSAPIKINQHFFVVLKWKDRNKLQTSDSFLFDNMCYLFIFTMSV